ncbi:MAG TPA: hypothetical protein VJY34_08825 [Roseiarcus sp.]|nr:hypothetical protein [Roseiarcus sp.]
MLTQKTVEPRILGKSESPTLVAGPFVTATGNNLRLIGDVTRRAIMCRIDAKVERPELREFDRNPVAEAKANRPAYVVAALTILRAYHVAGRPKKPKPLGSFDDWSNRVRGALIWLGCADPCETMVEIRADDPKRSLLQAVVAAWREAFGREQVTAAQAVKQATEQRRADTYEGHFEFVNDELREALLLVAGKGGQINGRALGEWLSANKDKVVNGAQFKHMGERHSVAVWALVEAQ